MELAARRRPHPQPGTATLLRHGAFFPLARPRQIILKPVVLCDAASVRRKIYGVNSAFIIAAGMANGCSDPAEMLKL